MKILGLVVVLIFIHCCSAANRTTVWFLGNNQIYSSSLQYKVCTLSGAAAATPSGLTTLLTTSKLSVSGGLIQVLSNAAGGTTFISNTALLGSLSIVFTYNSTHYLTLSLTSPGTAITISGASSVSAILSPVQGATSLLTATPSGFPIIIDNNRVLTPIGTTWLTFTYIQELYTSTANPTSSSGIQIVDYVSSSTIAILQTEYTGATSTFVNSFYQVAVRTLTSSITGSNILSGGCSVSGTGRKRSVDHLKQKRALNTCPSSLYDSSLASSATICTDATSIYGTGATATVTDTPIQDAVIRGMNAINAIYTTDTGYLSAANSKITTGAIFGTILAMASFILVHLY